MPINLIPIMGDICDMAPPLAHVAILQLKSGYCMRDVTYRRVFAEWGLRKVEYFHAFPQDTCTRRPERPWIVNHDSLYSVNIPGNNIALKYMYMFANPSDCGFATLDDLDRSLRNCLNNLAQIDAGITKLSMIHLALNGNDTVLSHKSAKHMVNTLKSWDIENPDRFCEAYLFDLSNGFRWLSDVHI